MLAPRSEEFQLFAHLIHRTLFQTLCECCGIQSYAAQLRASACLEQGHSRFSGIICILQCISSSMPDFVLRHLPAGTYGRSESVSASGGSPRRMLAPVAAMAARLRRSVHDPAKDAATTSSLSECVPRHHLLPDVSHAASRLTAAALWSVLIMALVLMAGS